MLTFLNAEAHALLRTLQALVLLALAVAFAPLARGGETRIAALHGFEAVEVKAQGFTLPKAAKVHVYARGAAVRTLGRQGGGNPFFAQGWILNAATREVVWQMDGMNTRRDWDYRVADVYLDLPAGRYEACFSNHGFAQGILFAQWSRNVDRRHLEPVPDRRHGLVRIFHVDDATLLRHWRDQVGNYGMEVYLATPGLEAAAFDAPLVWDRVAVQLKADRDSGFWSQAFHLSRPVSLHVYAEGEGSGRRMADTGWIQDLRTRERVWEMTVDKSRFAGGAAKNRRQVETVQLPAGDYLACFATDDSHSPADWNAAPPCDPFLYGLTLSLPTPADQGALALRPLPEPGPVLVELVKVKDDQDLKASFTLAKAQAVRVQALGEASARDLADTAWIEDAQGKEVWRMTLDKTHHAGGAWKNREADVRLDLPKGTYTLRVKTDGSHAYGDWNTDPPREAERYGATVYGVR